MESINQQPGQNSKIEAERVNAMKTAFSQIESIRKEFGLSELDAAKKIVKESGSYDNYRLEQAAAKLVEFFEHKEELKKREAEIMRWIPDDKNLLNTEAANDANFDSKDKKYLVS